MPVMPAIQEAEAGEWLEPGRQDHGIALQPGQQERNSISKQNKKQQKSSLLKRKKKPVWRKASIITEPIFAGECESMSTSENYQWF